MRLIAALLFALVSVVCEGQTTDIFLMAGSDFTRPGMRANLNIGVGRSMTSLNKIKIGNEATFSYTYENAGSHGFWHTDKGAHTESIGLMKNIPIGKQIIYSWQQVGITSLTGGEKGVQNRLYSGASIGYIIPVKGKWSLWLQESYNKVETVPWYTTTSIGVDYSF